MDLYIYYRVPVQHSALLLPRVLAMQADLGGTSARCKRTALKRRPQPKDGCHTWMEVYEAVDEEFAKALDDALAVSGIADLIDGPRHAEHFEDVAPCA